LETKAASAFWGSFFSAFFCILISFLNVWGNPSWFDAFPLASAYRFMNALLVYALSCLIYFSLAFFISPMENSGGSLKRIFFVVSFFPCLVFAGLILLRVRLQVSDLFVEVFFSVGWAVSGFCALFMLRRERGETDSRRIWAWGTAVCGGCVVIAEICGLFFRIPGIIPESLFFFLFVVTAVTAFLYSPGPHRAENVKTGSYSLSIRDAGGFGISEREWEVVNLLLEGKTNQEIADALYISLSTVKTHLKNIFEKTGTRNRMEAANILRPIDHPKG
jgi:DNA-binding CsgD family transcriptional regulator